LEVALDLRLRGMMAGRDAAGEAQIADSGLDAIELRVARPGRRVGHAQREIAGGKVEGNAPVLEIEAGGAVLVVQNALLDGDAADLQIEEAVQGGLTRLLRLARLRLVGGAVGVDDQMELGLKNLQAAQREVGNPPAQHAPLHAHGFDLGVGRFAGGLMAVNDDSSGLGLQAQ
jgi:hypothetical protein